jgi:hypothetical protein
MTGTNRGTKLNRTYLNSLNTAEQIIGSIMEMLVSHLGRSPAILRANILVHSYFPQGNAEIMGLLY